MPRSSSQDATDRAVPASASRFVALDVPAGMASAKQLQENLTKSLARGKSTVTVAVGTIGFPDVSVLQVLCAAHRRALQRGVGFDVDGDGAGAVAYLAGLCGLDGPASCGLGEDVTCPWAHFGHSAD